jgi:DNA polymerase
MGKTFSAEFWKILDTFEDYLRYGYRQHHPDPPRVQPARGGPLPSGGRARGPQGNARGSAPRQGEHGGAVSPEPEAWYAPRVPQSTRRQLGLPDIRVDMSREEREEAMETVAEKIKGCVICPLHQGRTNAVPGYGVLDPKVMVIGEGPGAQEDQQGLPFVGRAGKYLDKWLAAIELSRETSAYIANIVKCRPPENRDPKGAEAEACAPYLETQIALVRPKTILTVGRVASSILIGRETGVGKLRGHTYSYRGIPLVVTYHPSGVLRNEQLRRPVWEDLKRLRALFPKEESGSDPGAGQDSERGSE